MPAGRVLQQQRQRRGGQIGREAADAAAEGVFVVVVVVVADKEHGTPSGTSCRLPRSIRGGKIQGRTAQTSPEPHPLAAVSADW
ncbi:MAG: hypothetical protein J0L63_08290 [Anaerolineae bacterium]|nr:hypothetical protein [Anaerolineae bacterium]